MKMLDAGVENVFTYETYQLLAKRIEKQRYSLIFDADTITMVRADSTRRIDSLVFIGTYTRNSLPPYEKVLKDIEDAAEEFDKEINRGAATA